MKTITQEDIIKNDHISTEDIKQDIIDTQVEVDDLKANLEILMKNPQDNKLQIYFVNSDLKERQNFIDNLNIILEYRKNNNYENK